MAEERSVDRLVAFTDAVVAIAITLLVLPLVELVPETTGRGTDTTEALARLLGDHMPQLIAFALSFALIARGPRAGTALGAGVAAKARKGLRS